MRAKATYPQAPISGRSVHSPCAVRSSALSVSRSTHSRREDRFHAPVGVLYCLTAVGVRDDAPLAFAAGYAVRVIDAVVWCAASDEGRFCRNFPLRAARCELDKIVFATLSVPLSDPA